MQAKASKRKDTVPLGGVRQWLIAYPSAVPAIIFLAISVVTLLSVFAIETGARHSESLQTRKIAASIASELGHEANIAVSYMHAGAVVLSSRGRPTPELLQQFSTEMEGDFEVPGAGPMGWLSRVDLADVDGQASPMFQETLAAVQGSGAPSSSGRLMIAGPEGGEVPAFLIVMPVLAGNTAEVEPRGFVHRAFNANMFLAAALDLAIENDLAVRLFDGMEDEAALLAERSSTAFTSNVIEKPIQIANRTMRLEVAAPTPALLTPLSVVTLLLGLSVAALLAMLARILTRQIAKDNARLEFFEEQHSIRNSLTRELNHRVKNTLANVLSLLSLTRRRADNLDDFAEGLAGRIRALSATHDLLTNSEWGTTPIASVVKAELAHVSAAREHEVEIEGPDVELAPNDALTLGQAIHELATNAAKYGALSDDVGRVSITWSLVDPDLAEVEWLEAGGPEVSEVRGSGFGTELIQKIVAHELRHPVELHFDTGGVRCTMRVPVRPAGEFQLRDQLAG